MRDYLYFWHEPKDHFIVASGIHFKDLAPSLSKAGGVLLLSHEFWEAPHDPNSGFDYVTASALEPLCLENIYSWGDFRWIDYADPHHPSQMTKQEVAEVLYFRHRSEPFSNIEIPSLKNRFLAYGHDDGWYLKIYYSAWSDMRDLLAQLKWNWSTDARSRILAGGQCAVWIDARGMTDEAATHDIDSVMNRCLRRNS